MDKFHKIIPQILAHNTFEQGIGWHNTKLPYFLKISLWWNSISRSCLTQWQYEGGVYRDLYACAHTASINAHAARFRGRCLLEWIGKFLNAAIFQGNTVHLCGTRNHIYTLFALNSFKHSTHKSRAHWNRDCSYGNCVNHSGVHTRMVLVRI